MCLAIYKPSGVVLDWDALLEGFRSNGHGAGFAVRVGDSLRIYKGFFTFDAFREAFDPFKDHQAAVHFRLATHGEKDTFNCHPFEITPELALIHNGILNIRCDLDAKKSDTWHYVEQILKPMAERDRDFYSRDDVRFMGESAIGGNKFVFLRGDGDYCIWNDDQGHWHEDAWWSNHSYQKSSFGFGYRSSSTPVRASEPLWFREEDEDETDHSTVYHDLTDREQLLYESLLEDGWDVSSLDEVIEAFGVNGLYDFCTKNDIIKE